ncbi:uncharacterized protein RBU33_014012 [Hipposideros larvatus]
MTGPGAWLERPTGGRAPSLPGRPGRSRPPPPRSGQPRAGHRAWGERGRGGRGRGFVAAADSGGRVQPGRLRALSRKGFSTPPRAPPPPSLRSRLGRGGIFFLEVCPPPLAEGFEAGLQSRRRLQGPRGTPCPAKAQPQGGPLHARRRQRRIPRGSLGWPGWDNSSEFLQQPKEERKRTHVTTFSAHPDNPEYTPPLKTPNFITFLPDELWSRALQKRGIIPVPTNNACVRVPASNTVAHPGKDTACQETNPKELQINLPVISANATRTV